VCDACVARFAPPVPRCATCALPVVAGIGQCGECVRHPPPLDACIAACSYAWPWPGRIAEFKFRGEAGLAGPLSMLLRSAPWVEPAVDRADIVLPMPLAPARLRERGFNQAMSSPGDWRPG
jgi:predicted amidophosphoribosyltransferase